VDNRPDGGGQRHGRGDRNDGGDGGPKGANDDAAADVVVDDQSHGGGQRQGRGRGHVGVHGVLLHPRHAGDASAHALGHGAGANDVVVDDRPDGGGQRLGRGDGNVGVGGGLVLAKQAADAVGHGHSRDVADGNAKDVCDWGDTRRQRGCGHASSDGDHAHIDHAGTGEDESVERRTVRVGRLRGGLSSLGGVSVSCRGDPLSSLDAEDLRFLADALS